MTFFELGGLIVMEILQEAYLCSMSHGIKSKEVILPDLKGVSEVFQSGLQKTGEKGYKTISGDVIVTQEEDNVRLLGKKKSFWQV